MNPVRYEKLPGRGITWGGPSRVWLAEDHVLLVVTRGFSEVYRRFFFKDIQAIVVRRTHLGKLWSALWAMPFACFLLIALLVDNQTAALVLASLALPFGVAVIINLLRGPTCACFIRTAVQMERVPAVSRVRAAEKLILRLEPLITGAQGTLPPEQWAGELASFQAGVATRTAPSVS